MVVVSYQSAADIETGLRSLVAAGVGQGVIVVDNASTDDSVMIVRRFAADGVRLIALDRNTGFTGGCNKGYYEAPETTPYVAFMNPDVRLSPDCLDRCVELLDRRPEVACVAPLLVRADGRTIDSAGQVLKHMTLEVEDRGYGEPLAAAELEPRRVLAACGALAVFRRQALEQVSLPFGPWDGRFFCFWEDLEIGWRLNNHGWQIWFEPAARAEHVRGAGADDGAGPLRWRRPVHLEACIASNRWMTLLRHLNVLDLALWAPVLLMWDLAVTCAGALRRPTLVWHLAKRLPLVAGVWKERKGGKRMRLAKLPW